MADPPEDIAVTLTVLIIHLNYIVLTAFGDKEDFRQLLTSPRWYATSRWLSRFG